MFNMKLIGMKISEKRKSNNLTQMELADLLSVSHQAISNWERGETMPDISKLPELAKIFHTSIDELLSGEKGTEVVKQVVSGQVPEKVDLEAFKNVSPILKPHQINTLSNDLEFNTLDDLLDCLPFISEATADKLVQKALEKTEHITNVTMFLPFVSEVTANKLVLKALEDDEIELNIIGVLPFVGEDICDKLVRKQIEKNSDISIKAVLPFITEETANRLVNHNLSQNREIENLQAILPFVSTEMCDQLVIKTMEQGRKISRHVLPFISSELAEKLVLKTINR